MKRYLHSPVHWRIVHNSQNVETTEVSVDRLIGKEYVAYIYNGILFSHEKKGKPAFHDKWMNLGDMMLSEINQTEKDTYCMISLLWNL